ncbi:MAG: hypothetical protein HUJ65_04030 [Oscillospiraceae bacterium]|nr:hypothetical protein [Oscillospiraceae bacterium]
MNDIIDLAAELIKKEFGLEVSTAYYANVRLWKKWWEGYEPSFHSYCQWGPDGRKIERRLYSLHMAKRVCEDWASILLNERTSVRVGDTGSAAFLQGEDGTGGVFGRAKFWRLGNELVERAFALGQGAFVLRVGNVALSEDGIVVPGADAQIGIEYLTALQILPITVSGGDITEAAFISEQVRRGVRFIYIELHTLGDDGCYVIRNRYYTFEDGRAVPAPLPEGMAEELYTGSPRKWFAMIRPNLSNNIPGANGMGISVYGNAIDVLKGVDLAYNNTNRDVYLGGKKVFYNKAMLQRTPDGRYITPDDVIQQLFTQVGDELDFNAKDMVQEFNPSLRAAENRESVQAQLDYLAFQCGLGTHRYQFGNSASVIRTATEYVGNKQELVQMASKHYVIIEDAVKTLCAGILYIGRVFCGADVDPDAEITVNFENSYIIDKDSEREQDLTDVREGLMSREEYRVKWYGDSKSEAEDWVRANPQE